MKHLFIFSAFITFCAASGFINPNFPTIFVGETFTISWDLETAPPVSLTLSSSETPLGFAIASGLFTSNYAWYPWTGLAASDSYVMTLVDGSGRSSTSQPFLIQDPNFASGNLTNGGGNTTSSGNTTLTSSVSGNSTNESFLKWLFARSAPQSLPTTSNMESTSTPIILTPSSESIPLQSTTPTQTLPFQSTYTSTTNSDTPISDEIITEQAPLHSPLSFKKEIQALTPTTTTAALPNTNLAVSITVVVFFAMLFTGIIAFEYGKRVGVKMVLGPSEGFEEEKRSLRGGERGERKGVWL